MSLKQLLSILVVMEFSCESDVQQKWVKLAHNNNDLFIMPKSFVEEATQFENIENKRLYIFLQQTKWKIASRSYNLRMCFFKIFFCFF